jgi:hypothetical protein
VHIPKFRNGTGKILANASMPDFSGASDLILGYALSRMDIIDLALLWYNNGYDRYLLFSRYDYC